MHYILYSEGNIQGGIEWSDYFGKGGNSGSYVAFVVENGMYRYLTPSFGNGVAAENRLMEELLKMEQK